MKQREALRQLLLRANARERIKSFFPASGPFSRDKYNKHIEFFAAGREHQERALIAANRAGKTICGAYEVALHLTGLYPDWWPGHRFTEAVAIWAAGDTAQTTRDIVQFELLGPPEDHGTGMIPYKCLGKISMARGTPNAVDTVTVKHASGGQSSLGFKAYADGREKFQGTARNVIWFDEEPPESVYDEALMRLMTTRGLMLCTFTPLRGLSAVALRFLPHLAPSQT